MPFPLTSSPDTMCSDGCIHGHPSDIKAVWQILTTKLGVEVRPNTNGHLPYPYKPQGLVAVEVVSA